MNYFIGNGQFDFNLIFVLGTSRAGKSLFSKILSTSQNIDWIFEPYVVQMTILLSELKKIEPACAENILKASCKEIINDDILMRNANFRPNDMSSIYNHKDAETIFHRLVNIHSREEVDQYIKERNMYFIMDIPDLLPHISYIKGVFPSAKCIHVVRDGCHVVKEITNKGWYSIERMQQRIDNYILYWKYKDKGEKEFYLPWWLPEERAADFISGTDEMRGVMYWNYSLDSIKGSEKDIDLTIRYEDLVLYPEKIMKVVEKLVECKWTAKTKMAMDELEDRNEKVERQRILNNLIDRDREMFEGLLGRYGYEQ